MQSSRFFMKGIESTMTLEDGPSLL